MKASRQSTVWTLLLMVGGASAWAQAPGFWRISVVDPVNRLYSFGCGLAFGPDGRPAVSYSGDTYAPNSGLWYAEFDGSTWQHTTLSTDSVGSNALAIFPTGPAVVYESGSIEMTRYGLYFAERTGSTWATTCVNQPDYCFHSSCNLATEPGTGRRVIVDVRRYPHWTKDALYWTYDNGAWQSEAAYTCTGSLFDLYGAALCYLPSGQAVIAAVNSYRAGEFDYYYRIMRTTRQSGGGWMDETLDIGDLNVQLGGVSAALLRGGDIGFSYWKGSETYFTPPLTQLASVASVTGTAMLPSGEPGVVYGDNGLKYAWRTAAGWKVMDVEAATVPIVMQLVAHPTTRQPALVYYDQTSHQVKYAIAFFRGDLNCDGLIDFGDINPFVLALSDPAGYAQAFPACDIVNGDINGDGRVDFEDINPFVALLTGS